MHYKSMDYKESVDSICLSLLALGVESQHFAPIISSNNTPPASRKNSAPRGVTRFWGMKK